MQDLCSQMSSWWRFREISIPLLFTRWGTSSACHGVGQSLGRLTGFWNRSVGRCLVTLFVLGRQRPFRSVGLCPDRNNEIYQLTIMVVQTLPSSRSPLLTSEIQSGLDAWVCPRSSAYSKHPNFGVILSWTFVKGSVGRPIHVHLFYSFGTPMFRRPSSPQACFASIRRETALRARLRSDRKHSTFNVSPLLS